MSDVVEHYGSADATDSGIDGFPGTDPAGTFGPAPTDSVKYGERIWLADVDGDDGGTDARNFSGGGGDNGDDFERNADGTVKRNKDGSARRKRGRKRGHVRGDNSRPQAKGSNVLSESFFASATMTGLNMVAAMAKAPEWGIEQDEATAWGKAIADLAAIYDFTPTKEQEAWAQFIMVIGVGVGSRVYLSIQRATKDNARNVSRDAKAPAPAKAPPVSSTPAPLQPATPGVTAGGAFPEFKGDG